MPRYQEIAERLQEMIDSGSLRFGDKIPPERVLAETFKVSRNCVREAIRTMAEKGVLESRQGDGTYVRAHDPDVLRRTFTEAFAAQQQRLDEIFEFRLALEPAIAALAAKQITPRDLDDLKIIVCDQQRRILAGEDDAENDAAFHLRLAKASRNAIMIDIMTALGEVIGESRSEFLQSPERRKASADWHLKLIDALEAKDDTRSRQIMSEHIRTARREALGQNPAATSPPQGEHP